MTETGENDATLRDVDFPLLPNKQQVHSGCRPSPSPSRAPRRASSIGAVFNLSTNIVGAGIMALPHTMRILGLIPGITMILSVALLTDASVEMLLRCSRAARRSSYAGVMGDAFRKAGRRTLQILVVVNNLGIMIVYLIITGDVLSGTSADGGRRFGLLQGWFGVQQWNSRPVVLLVIILVVLAPLTSFKRVDSLRITSALSVALAVVFVAITAWIAIYKLEQGSTEMPKLFPHLTDWQSVCRLFTAAPVLATAYVFHYNIHVIDDELRNSSQIRRVVRISLALSTAVYVATSVFAYLLFGESTLDDVLANFDSDLRVPFGAVVSDVVRASYAAHVVLVFPVVFFALRLYLDGLLFHGASPLAADGRRFGSLTALLLAVVYSAAVFVPSIWVAFQATGATATVCIGFIFPACLILKDSHGVATRRDKMLAVVMILLSVLSSSAAMYSNFHSAFAGGVRRKA